MLDTSGRGNAFLDYFRCPADSAPAAPAQDLSNDSGYFRVGDAIAYGRAAGVTPARYATDHLQDVSGTIRTDEGRVVLPLDRKSTRLNSSH